MDGLHLEALCYTGTERTDGSFVPTEYDNIYMDYEGFIYACTTHVTKSTLEDGTADPIRRLNMMGSDILSPKW